MRRHFFPSERRVRARWVAMCERQLDGRKHKLPSESWSELRRARRYSALAKVGGLYIRERLREAGGIEA